MARLWPCDALRCCWYRWQADSDRPGKRRMRSRSLTSTRTGPPRASWPDVRVGGVGGAGGVRAPVRQSTYGQCRISGRTHRSPRHRRVAPARAGGAHQLKTKRATASSTCWESRLTTASMLLRHGHKRSPSGATTLIVTSLTRRYSQEVPARPSDTGNSAISRGENLLYRRSQWHPVD